VNDLDGMAACRKRKGPEERRKERSGWDSSWFKKTEMEAIEKEYHLNQGRSVGVAERGKGWRGRMGWWRMEWGGCTSGKWLVYTRR